ncbi:MAG: BTAD domain-containing putative transcriptional regulator [Umezawaea sp.]
MGTRFTLLGEVGAHVDGPAVEIRQGQLRRLLALLLVDVGRAASADAPADRMWGERLPRQPREALYSYVSRLRAVLTDVVIESRSSDYALVADPAAVDLHRFRALVAEAGSVPDDEAATALAEALALWTGEAFAGMDSPWFDATREVLARERLGARLDLADLWLRDGRHPVGPSTCTLTSNVDSAATLSGTGSLNSCAPAGMAISRRPWKVRPRRVPGTTSAPEARTATDAWSTAISRVPKVLPSRTRT